MWLNKFLGIKQDKDVIRHLRRILKSHDPPPAFPSREERTVIHSIRRRTERHNCNNVTRTKAYLDFYETHPEVHWAFLAHMVSRNGGWSMTDVQGSLLKPVLTARKARSLFDMFERINWLIFHDAYPQLQVYAESVARGVPLFHVLPQFGISRFMVPVWQRFWDERDASLLTVALIINEQQFIEARVIKHAHYRRTVLQTALFKLQTAFDFNQVVFPLASESTRPRLVGRTMHNFADVRHRIKTGRQLYHILFHPAFHERIHHWAVTHPHSGSRADYWPERFTAEAPPAGERVYSPRLADAWRNVSHRPAEQGDWYAGRESLSAVVDVTEVNKQSFYMTDVYERSYRRLWWLSLIARRVHAVFSGNS